MKIDKSLMENNRNYNFDHENANNLVISIFEKYYNPNVSLEGHHISVQIFDDIDFESIGLDLNEVDDQMFINQFEHLLFMFRSASGFMSELKTLVKKLLKVRKDDSVEKVKSIKKMLDFHMEEYEKDNGSTLKLDLLRLFGLPIKDSSFTITTEIDGETVTL